MPLVRRKTDGVCPKILRAIWSKGDMSIQNEYDAVKSESSAILYHVASITIYPLPRPQIGRVQDSS